MSLKPFSEKQRRAAVAWCGTLDKSVLAQGADLLKKQAVFNVLDFGRSGIQASVQSGKRYTATLDFIDGGWWSECECPDSTDCKHCAAGMLKALTLLEMAAPPASPEPQKPTKRRGRQPKAVPEPEPVEEIPEALPETFSEILEAKIGRPLSAREDAAASAMDELFLTPDISEVPAASLAPLRTHGAGDQDGWTTVKLWPAPPRSLWEAWLYVANYLRREGFFALPAFDEVTDWTEVDALVTDWQRSENVEQWRRWLGDSAKVAVETRVHDLRVRLMRDRVLLEWRKHQAGPFKPMSYRAFMQLASSAYEGKNEVAPESLGVWNAFHTGYDSQVEHMLTKRDAIRILNTTLRREDTRSLVVSPMGEPFHFAPGPLTWRTDVEERDRVDYQFSLATPDGSPLPRPMIVIDGDPSLFVTRDTVFEAPPLGGFEDVGNPIIIPAEAVESSDGLALLARLKVQPPARLAGRFRTEKLRPVFDCALESNEWGDAETLRIRIFAEGSDESRSEVYARDGWTPADPDAGQAKDDGMILLKDRNSLTCVPDLIAELNLSWTEFGDGVWQRKVTGKFPEAFSEWLQTVPADAIVELDELLQSLRDPSVVARVTLDVKETGIDWFDIRIALDVADTTLTKAEIKALLDAKGDFVRLGDKGWRRLAFSLSAEDEAELAELGLSASDVTGPPTRLHALQLAGKRATKNLINEETARAIERRAEEIRTRVQPALPDGIHAELRPYQLEGFHFLAYLSENRFGGILADDMGLGKTLQTLTWIQWLRGKDNASPALVICPKSVTDNWRSEAARFAPSITVTLLPAGANAKILATARAEAGIVVANYAQLRILAAAITAVPWSAVILDEAQAIKNPASSTAKAAWAIQSEHRLALSGTPIENRLLDLWSIMQFAMPGILGTRSAFGKTYDQRGDPLARKRLSARVRPFVIRRTKSEVAKDLPPRIEEDLHCELDGQQATLYRAELKRARAALLSISTKAQLDTQRFHILSSLLRLRQICCHPTLIGASKRKAALAAGEPLPEDTEAAPDSAKLNALIDILEPLIEEGHKVLVFSQFVEMLNLIRAELTARNWPQYILTGETEERGKLVNDFQTHDGSAVFLISLRAGGFGLNLTAASYVVLFDPWWNPAVEAQAIDRTHRIGQENQVIAYRLIVKNSIEEKIRALQKKKSDMAGDILGEESFARALTLDDFQFLFSE